MASSPQMYDTGLENLKSKAALTVKVRSYLNGNGEVDPADLENPELSLDLQSLIDDPNFEVGDGLFPELLHEKHQQLHAQHISAVNFGRNHQSVNNSHPHVNNGHFGRNALAYMPQPVHQGATYNNGNSANSTSNNNIILINSNSNNVPINNVSYLNSPMRQNNLINNTHNRNPESRNGSLVKEEPMDQNRIDFNGNAVSSSDPSSYGSYSNPLSNVTSPSSSSSQGYSPNSYVHPQHHSLPQPTNGQTNGHGESNGNANGGGLVVTKNGGLSFNGKGFHHHHHHHSSSMSKKLKNVDKGSDEYKRRRERNNIAVRKSREKAKVRSRETEERVKLLNKENERLQKKIEVLTEELTFLRSFFSNVGGLPEQIHREFNKHLETFQHHHMQNGIQ